MHFSVALSGGLLLFSSASGSPLVKRQQKTYRYRAFGDSYSAGPGAGGPTGSGNGIFTSCVRYDGSYPFQLEQKLNNRRLASDDFHSCTGDKTPEIEQQASAMNKDVDIATISLGGNDVGFSDIVNSCIYRFIGYGIYTPKECSTAIDQGKELIQTVLQPNVKKTLDVFRSNGREDATIIVTGYPRFWTEPTGDRNNLDNWDPQCTTANWAYWTNSQAEKAFMTAQLRRDMNDMVNDVNTKIQNAVNDVCAEEQESGPPCRVRFVDYNGKWDGQANGRFCNKDVNEPQKKTEPEERPEILVGQYYTKFGQFAPDADEYVPVQGDLEEFAKQYAEFMKNDTAPGFQVNENYAAIDAQRYNAAQDAVPSIVPKSIVRVFHPTKKGHELMAESVMDALKDMGVVDGGSTPIDPSTHPLTCQGSLPANFPNKWGFSDGPSDTRNLFYRMRDQLCQDKCETVNGISEGEFNLMKHDRGCTASIKVSATKEVYMYASKGGDNCYKLSARLIDECPGNDERYSGITNGDKLEELYQVGLRNLNTPNGTPGSDHPPMTTESIHHLPYPQLACQRVYTPPEVPCNNPRICLRVPTIPHQIVFDYSVALRDYHYDTELLNKAKDAVVNGCGVRERNWEMAGEGGYTFEDQNGSTQMLKFGVESEDAPDADCISGKLAEVLEATGGGFKCDTDFFQEVNRMT